MAKYVKTEDGYQEIEVINSNKMNKHNPVGTGSFSMGRKAGTIVGSDSHAEGYNTTASGNNSHAEGFSTAASGSDSHAEGYNTTASGSDSHAEGYNTKASGNYSHAEGSGTKASGISSHAEGGDTTASGHYSHAEGGGTTASGNSSHAEGSTTTASGGSSHAEGNNTRAASINQHVQGKFNIVDDKGTYAHIVGNGTNSSRKSNAHTLDWNGNAWFEGDIYVGSTSGTDKDAGSKKLATEEYVDNKVSDFGGIQSPTNAKVGQTIVVKAIDENGKPTEWEVEDKPDKLPNPNALTFNGAVTGSYDGSAPLSVEIPQGGGGIYGLLEQYNMFELAYGVLDSTNLPTRVVITEDSGGNAFDVDGIIVWTDIKSTVSYTNIAFNNRATATNPGGHPYHYGLSHGNRSAFNLYLCGANNTFLQLLADDTLKLYKKQNKDVDGINFEPSVPIKDVPSSITAICLCSMYGISSGTFYKVWGLKKKNV